MADYYSLIKKAVGRLDPDAPADSRQALYERARVAQLNQLRSLSPSLTKAEIAREQLALEDAVRKVEAETAQRAADVPVPASNDLAAGETGNPKARAESRSTVAEKDPTNPPSPDQTNEAMPPMIVTGGATGRLIRYWRWRSLLRSNVA